MPREYKSPKTDAIFAALKDIGSMNAAELELHTGFTRLVVNDCLRRLRDKGLIYIARFERQPEGLAGRCIPFYSAGCGVDAMEPKQLTSKQRNAMYRKRHRARLNARMRARRGSVINVWKGLM